LYKYLINIFSISEKLKIDTIWNLFSYLVIGLCGLSLPIIIAKYYNPNTLGILNISLIILTICSQISGFGIHFSVLKTVSQYSKDIYTVNTIMISSLILVTITSSMFCLLFYILINPINSLFPEKNMIYSLTIITPALYFLSVNKIIFGYYNALRRMKYYAILNMIRYLNWIIFLIVFINIDMSYLYLSAIFLASEIVVFLINIPLIIIFLKSHNRNKIFDWSKEHLIFGFKAMYGAIFVDFNSRVDVLALGFFTNSYITGIYTIASMIVDGFLQLINVFRIIINPIITRYYNEFSRNNFISYLKKGKVVFYLIGVPLIIITMILFPLIIDLTKLGSEYSQAYIPLVISLFGLMISFGYHPYQMIFIQTGLPLVQTIFWGALLTINLILSSVLIYSYGIIGAGIVTAIGYSFTPIIINYLTKKYLRLSF
jgi:O-antigen/teichoic acid export membrane protein